MDDLDDLFGEPNALDSTSLISPALCRELDQAARRGTCHKAQWSSWGTIAYLDPHGSQVCLQTLYREPHIGRIQLSRATIVGGDPLQDSSTSPVGVSWDPSGQLLAVFSLNGQVSIYTTYLASNRLQSSRLGQLDIPDELGAVVGQYWLNQSQLPLNYHGLADADGHSYRKYTSKQYKASRPNAALASHLLKSTLLIVTRKLLIRVLYQDQVDNWHEIRQLIDKPRAVGCSLTQAALCSDVESPTGSLLLVTHDTLDRLCVYKLRIEFDQRAILIENLTTLGNVSSQSHFDHLNLAGDPRPRMLHALTRLDLVAGVPNASQDSLIKPYVLAHYTGLDSSIQPGVSATSIVARYPIRSVQILSTDLFQKCPPEPGVSDQNLPSEVKRERWTLEMEACVSIPRCVLSISFSNANTLITLVYHDGTVETRFAEDLNDAASSADTLFTFPDEHQSYMYAAISPNLCAYLAVDNLGLSTLHVHNYSGKADNDALEKLAEDFAVHYSKALRTACGLAEDLFLVLEDFTLNQLAGLEKLEQQDSLSKSLCQSQIFRRKINREMQLLLPVDFANNSTDLLSYCHRNFFVQRCLGIQMALEYPIENATRSAAYFVAFTCQTLRFLSLFHTVALKQMDAEIDSRKKAETMKILYPISSWLLYLIDFLMDEIFEMRRHFGSADGEETHFGSADGEETHFGTEALNQYICDKQTPSLILLLHPLPRILLKHNCRSVQNLVLMASKYPRTSGKQTVYDDFKRITSRSHVQLVEFDGAIKAMEGVCEKTYKSQEISTAERTRMENDLLTLGQVSEVGLIAAKHLIFEITKSLLPQVKETQLYFKDFSDLDLINDEATKQAKRDQPMDNLRRVPLEQKTVKRQCLRCCCITADTVSSGKAVNFVTSLTKVCLCGSPWILIGNADGDLGETVP